MASEPLLGSEANIPKHTVPSSPPPTSQDGNQTRPKKPPPITPKRFRKFFTPRSSLQARGIVRTSRQALQDITRPVVNRNGTHGGVSKGKQDHFGDILDDENLPPLSAKRRRLSLSSNTSSLRSSPIKPATMPPSSSYDEVAYEDTNPVSPSSSPSAQPGHVKGDKARKPQPLRRSKALRSVRTPILREVYGDVLGKASTPRVRWEYSTANFFSGSRDVHTYNNPSPSHVTLPFCTAGCNNEANSLVAVGDEEGCVRFLESADNGRVGFDKTYLSFYAHHNAIMDIAFSSDDSLLATAAGDQTASIVDVMTQQTTFTMSGHTSSVKNVRFQPGSGDKVVATCSRDGSVRIWDLRCQGAGKAPIHIRCSMGGETEDSGTVSSQRTTWVSLVNAIQGAHARVLRPNPSRVGVVFENGMQTGPQTRGESVSVTSLAFLKGGREHLLATGSEANACVRLWDLRTTYNGRRGRPAPVSTTRQPESHDNFRQFGLTSLTLDGNGARLFAVCRDNTVYAYATSHLILGHAPELQPGNSQPRRPGGAEREALGPTYGFRHPQFHASSFYIKAGVRPAIADKDELLAVGSNDNCAVLFPTDERLLSRQHVSSAETAPPPSGRVRPGLRRVDSGTSLSGRLKDTIPIYRQGTPLIEGHRKEVTALTWTSDGNLVTIGDDLSARCWREGATSRSLRQESTGGQRWMCGWADVDASFDLDDEPGSDDADGFCI